MNGTPLVGAAVEIVPPPVTEAVSAAAELNRVAVMATVAPLAVVEAVAGLTTRPGTTVVA